MWYLIEIVNDNEKSVDCITLDFHFNSLKTNLKYLIYKNYKSGECKKVTFSSELKEKLWCINRVTDYIEDQLGTSDYLGFCDIYLFAINIWEYKLLSYFDEVGIVDRCATIQDERNYYSTCVNHYNMLILEFNLNKMSIMRLLLRHPEIFAFDEDALYYEFSGCNFAFKYKYLRGRDNLISVITKFRIAGDY